MLAHARVAIVGGGVAGTATALALANAGQREVVVLEAARCPAPRVGETIPPDARRLLGRLEAGAAFDAERHAPCHGSASCWGRDELGYNDFILHPLGHGWHLDRARFDAWLSARAAAAGVARELGARVRSIREDDGCWRLELDGQRQLRADIVVDATGTSAAIARQLGARRLQHDRFVYLACTLAPNGEAPASGQTWLEAVPEGWWYAAQLPDRTWTVAIATHPDEVRPRGLNESDGWQRALEATRHLHPRLGHLAPLQAPTPWVVPSFLLGPPAGPRWLAVGDAAGALDPICARGIHKALEDGLRASAAIRATLAGDATAIATFARHTVLAFRGYLEQRAWLYAQEARWPERPFWQQRRLRRNLREPTVNRQPPAPSAA